jgi:hypothetical protein
MGMRATGQPSGAGPGRSQAKGPLRACDGETRLGGVGLIDGWLCEVETVAAPPQPTAHSASAASPRTGALEIAVPVAGAAGRRRSLLPPRRAGRSPSSAAPRGAARSVAPACIRPTPRGRTRATAPPRDERRRSAARRRSRVAGRSAMRRPLRHAEPPRSSFAAPDRARPNPTSPTRAPAPGGRSLRLEAIRPGPGSTPA